MMIDRISCIMELHFARKRCKVLVEGYNGDSEPDKA